MSVVQRLRALIACLMLALTLWAGAAAHAAEAADCVAVPVTESTAHFDGDGDEVPADSHDATPHHHGSCSGHHYAMPSPDRGAMVYSLTAAPAAPAETSALAATESDPALRPPIA